MVLSDVAVRRPVLAAVFSLLLIVFGLISFTRLPLRELPKIDPPIVSIDTTYPGASASIVETRITQVIEDQLTGIEGVKYIRATSQDTRSSITVEFELNRDIDDAANDVRDAVARAADGLPEEADPPEVVKEDADADPIMWLNMASTTLSRTELSDYAARFIVRRLGVVDGVARVRIGGEQRPAVLVRLDRTALAARGLTPLDVEAALRAENVELPAGALEGESQDLPIRVERGYRTADQFAKLVVLKGEDGQHIRLGDVAKVERGSAERRRFFQGNGQPMLGLGVVAQSNANQVAVAAAVRAELESIRPSLPEGTDIYSSFDSTVFVNAAIKEVWTTLGIALFLVLAVIYVFLGSARTALVPAVVVPICLVAAFIAVAAFGFSINLITLLALVLCIGLVVDDSIVVLENIERRIALGEPPVVAAYRGAREVGFAVIATTLALIGAFVSLAFLEGFVGRLFRELALTISAAVALSSLIALTLSPAMCSKLLKPASERGQGRGLLRRFDAGLQTAMRAYDAALERVIGRPLAAGVLLLAMGGLSAVLFLLVPQDLAPEEDRGFAFGMMSFADGAGFDHAREQMLKVEDILIRLVENEEAQRVLVTSPSFDGVAYDTGRAIIVLEPWSERDRSASEIIAELRRDLGALPGVAARIGAPQPLQRGSGGDNVQFVLKGADHDEIYRWAQIVMQKARTNPAFGYLRLDYEPRTPKAEVTIDRERAADLGVTAEAIGRTLETMIASRQATTFIDRGEEYDVLLQAAEADRSDFLDLANINVRSDRTGALVPLGNLIRIETIADSPRLNRLDRLRSITLTASLNAGYTQGEALSFLERTVAEELEGESVQVGYLGGSLQYKEASNAFIFLFLMAMLIVYLVLAGQFESFIHPFIIMLTVPVAVTGGLFGLYLADQSLNIYSQIGLVILIGLAAKNGILIVEFANQLRDQGRSVEDAIREAARIRFRPLMMTALSTSFGALPLMLGGGPGAESRGSIGVVIFTGVMVATLLTLFIVPIFYRLVGGYTKSPKSVADAIATYEAGERTPAE
ncbi:MAG: efflux RND transporter permease subunit [Pseudomonadota bacterium]